MRGVVRELVFMNRLRVSQGGFRSDTSVPDTPLDPEGSLFPAEGFGMGEASCIEGGLVNDVREGREVCAFLPSPRHVAESSYNAVTPPCYALPRVCDGGAPKEKMLRRVLAESAEGTRAERADDVEPAVYVVTSDCRARVLPGGGLKMMWGVVEPWDEERPRVSAVRIT
jgi:hypothetical protein